MTCLIALGGNGPPKLPRKILVSDVCVAADSGADLMARLGRRPDLVVGDFDSISRRSESEAAEKETHPRDKDESDAELAMLAARRLGCDAWVVAGGSGGRFDHLLNLLHLANHYPEWKQWWLEEETVFLLRDGEELHLSGTPGMRLSVFCHNQTPEASILSEGLRWRLEGLDWTRRVSLSNELSDNEIRLRAKRGFFLVTRPLEDAFEFSL